MSTEKLSYDLGLFLSYLSHYCIFFQQVRFKTIDWFQALFVKSLLFYVICGSQSSNIISAVSFGLKDFIYNNLKKKKIIIISELDYRVASTQLKDSHNSFLLGFCFPTLCDFTNLKVLALAFRPIKRKKTKGNLHFPVSVSPAWRHFIS